MIILLLQLDIVVNEELLFFILGIVIVLWLYF